MTVDQIIKVWNKLGIHSSYGLLIEINNLNDWELDLQTTLRLSHLDVYSNVKNNTHPQNSNFKKAYDFITKGEL